MILSRMLHPMVAKLPRVYPTLDHGDSKPKCDRRQAWMVNARMAGSMNVSMIQGRHVKATISFQMGLSGA